MRRSPLSRKTPLKSGGRVNPVSKKRKAVNVDRRVFVQEVLTRIPICQARLETCNYWAQDVHEIKTRARGGSILDADNVMALCRPCHTYITDHPAFADANGFTVHSWE